MPKVTSDVSSSAAGDFLIASVGKLLCNTHVSSMCLLLLLVKCLVEWFISNVTGYVFIRYFAFSKHWNSHSTHRTLFLSWSIYTVLEWKDRYLIDPLISLCIYFPYCFSTLPYFVCTSSLPCHILYIATIVV